PGWRARRYTRRRARSKSSDLTFPRPVGDRAPARPHLLELARRQPARPEQRRVLRPPLRPGGADDGGVNARHTQREAQRGGGGCLGRTLQERIVESPQTRPVGLVVRLGRLLLVSPGDVGEGALGGDAPLPRARPPQAGPRGLAG